MPQRREDAERGREYPLCGVKVVTHFSYREAFGSAARPLSLYGRTTPQFGYPNMPEASRRTEMKTGVAESNHDGQSPLGLDIRSSRGRAGRGPCQHMFAAHENPPPITGW
jgi:hypothetical protein